ncbi:unnamed protein product [Caenorhabditis angaria]|uniref:Uncharacterized protein n=1 Tax=Caenorhabditis angaria TaxID=860376 RepID=A0A9P1IUR4_9PELO|nr:unnamed protein product [Caenorhabditis angaria]
MILFVVVLAFGISESEAQKICDFCGEDGNFEMNHEWKTVKMFLHIICAYKAHKHLVSPCKTLINLADSSNFYSNVQPVIGRIGTFVCRTYCIEKLNAEWEKKFEI